MEDGIEKLKENAVLVHKLPQKNVKEFLERSHNRKNYILEHFHNNQGLYIYFHNADQAIQFARGLTLVIEGKRYKISLAVTYLTVHGVATYTQDIKTLMERNGYKNVIDFYTIADIEDIRGHQSSKIVPDYLIVLNVAEIFSKESLTPIKWQKQSFKVSFFCQFCLENGHKAFQCSNRSTREFSSCRIRSKEYSSNLKNFIKCPSNLHSDTMNFNANQTSGSNCPCSGAHSSRSMCSFQSQNLQSESRETTLPQVEMDVQSKVGTEYARGILIHKLPSENVKEALNSFPSEIILEKFHNATGFYIFFKDAYWVLKYVRKRIIKVEGQVFDIYILVTNLTLRGIATYTGNIKSLIESNGYRNVIDVYPVKIPVGKNKFSTLPDYRVVLDIPEILFPDNNLPPIEWPGRPNYVFELDIFCRLCRTNGHKSYQCTKGFQTDTDSNNCTSNKTMTDKGHPPCSKDLKKKHIKLKSTASTSNDRKKSSSSPHQSVSETRHSVIFNAPHCSMKIEAQKEMKNNSRKLRGVQAESEAASSRACTEKTVSVSDGIKEAILLTHGVLSANSLINFLNSVRRRKEIKFIEITLSYTRDIKALITQLDLVKKNYYLSVTKRGVSEDRDLRFLKDLGERLYRLKNSGRFTKRKTKTSDKNACSSAFSGESSSKSQRTETNLTDASSDSD